MTWRLILEREHRLLYEVIEAAEEECDCIDASGRCHIDLVADMIEFFRYFGEGLHDPKEEGLLFVRLHKRGMTNENGTLGQLINDHQWCRGRLDELQATVAMIKSGNAGLIGQLSAQLREYVAVVRRHLDVEESEFFDTVSHYLTQADLNELTEEFEAALSYEVEEGVQAFYEQLANRVRADEREVCG